MNAQVSHETTIEPHAIAYYSSDSTRASQTKDETHAARPTVTLSVSYLIICEIKVGVV